MVPIQLSYYSCAQVSTVICDAAAVSLIISLLAYLLCFCYFPSLFPFFAFGALPCARHSSDDIPFFSGSCVMLLLLIFLFHFYFILLVCLFLRVVHSFALWRKGRLPLRVLLILPRTRDYFMFIFCRRGFSICVLACDHGLYFCDELV